MDWKRACFVIVAVAWISFCGWTHGASSAELTITDAEGSPVRWSSWLEDHGRTAVVLWASWAPEAQNTVESLDELAGAARSKDLEMVLISVQESVDEAGAALAGSEVAWLNDRYGGLLKQYRIVEIPSLVVVARDGRVLARLDVTAQALREWKNE